MRGLYRDYKDITPRTESQTEMRWRFLKIKGTFWGGRHAEDYSILRSIWGSPYSVKLPNGS